MSIIMKIAYHPFFARAQFSLLDMAVFSFNQARYFHSSMDRVISYLANLKSDRYGERIALVPSLMADLNISREVIFTQTMKARDQGLVQIATTLDPIPDNLSCVGLLERGRLHFKGEGYSHIPNPQENKLPYNLLPDQTPEAKNNNHSKLSARR